MTLAQWLAAPASVLTGYERWYVYALFASQSRDMPMPPESAVLMRVHHWLVVIACVLTLLAPQGFGLFVAGTFILECGSMTYNLRELYPESKAMQWLYYLAMPISNILAICGGIYMLGMPGLPVWMKVLYFLADIGVCLGRQRHALKDAGLISSSSSADVDEGGAPMSGEAEPSVATSALLRRKRSSATQRRLPHGCRPRRGRISPAMVFVGSASAALAGSWLARKPQQPAGPSRSHNMAERHLSTLPSRAQQAALYGQSSAQTFKAALPLFRTALGQHRLR